MEKVYIKNKQGDKVLPVTHVSAVLDDQGNDVGSIIGTFEDEVRGLVDTPHQNYVTVSATSSTTSATSVLPASGQSADTIYRVANWDGSANSGAGSFDVTKYSEYAWDDVSTPAKYVFLCVKSQIDQVFDITVYNNNTTYADLTAALGTNGANVPESLRRGGMSVKYVQTSDNKYVQYRLMSDTFNTTVANWQGVDDEPTAGSDNLVKSGCIYKNLFKQFVAIEQGRAFRSKSNILLNSGDKYRIVIIPDNSNIFSNNAVTLRYILSDGTIVTNIDAQDSSNGTAFVPLKKEVTCTVDNVVEIQTSRDVASGVIGSGNLYISIIKSDIFELGIDDTPIQNSNNPVKSGGVYNGLLESNLFTEAKLALIKNELGIRIFEISDMLSGFYKKDLSFEEGNGWRCKVIDVSDISSFTIKVKASVRTNAYLSITDDDNNILWQTNDNTTIEHIIDLSVYPTVSKLYLSTEISNVADPNIVIDEIKKSITSIENKISSDKIYLPLNLANIGFFYNSNLVRTTSSNFNCDILNIKGINSKITIKASVRLNAYLSITDESDNILWQSNDSSITLRTIDLSLYPTAAKLYFSNEITVVNEPYVFYYSDYYCTKTQVGKINKNENYKLAHFSFDDVHFCLEDITTNKDVYDSIFDNPFFAALKSCHDLYGMTFSLWVFETATASDGQTAWNINSVTSEFASDFSANSDWLKFNLHTGTYANVITELLRITGNLDCIDTVPRLHAFSGNMNRCLECRDAECGIDGLLTADDNRNSYYLDTETSELVYNRGKYFDANTQLFFFKSLLRLEYDTAANILNNLITKSGHNYSNNAILFTHEYELYDSSLSIINSMLDKIKYCGEWCYNHGYVWTYLMYKIKKNF